MTMTLCQKIMEDLGKKRWGRGWQRRGLASHRATSLKDHALGRATVPLFARRRAFTEGIAEAFAVVASALNTVKIIRRFHLHVHLYI
ncbi:hypothetical protein HHK36_014667 [Tetracentron sinense]|uniref:Uncharacterized protein n=1 Tax=Tetracentron sinense TaxID=13715 RepID=A0A835DFG0_TETSI|nr:hypothetical protein HHK36_014667 [Tetracentron sinense]